MARKAVNDLGPMVEERAREYIKEGCNQKVSVKLLQEEFPTLSIAMITNAFKKVKAMVKEEKTLEAVKEAVKLEEVKNEVEYDEEIEAMAEYILEEEVKESIVEEKEAEKKAKEAEKKREIPAVEDKVEEIKVEGSEKEMSNLKVVKEVVKVVSRELEGEFGKYIADENGVKREDKTFKDLAAVEIYKKEQLAKFEREIAELEAVFEYMSE